MPDGKDTLSFLQASAYSVLPSGYALARDSFNRNFAISGVDPIGDLAGCTNTCPGADWNGLIDIVSLSTGTDDIFDGSFDS